jgi:nucleotide-binding universal stress UspA family protein
MPTAMDRSIKRILAAVDGSPPSKEVTEVAFHVGARFDAVVHLFRAVRPPSDFALAAHTTAGGVDKFIINEAARSLAALAAPYPPIVVEKPLLESAEPWRSILGAAQRLDVDLIVIGSYGYGGWDRRSGVTAANLTSHADRHVWVVNDRNGGGMGA